MGKRVVNVEFGVEIPVDATDEQIDEWLRYTFGAIGGMSGENPLKEYDGEAIYMERFVIIKARPCRS